VAAARFRQARDSYKILCKQDPQKFLPGLIDVNSRLAEEMMQKGMISEAEAVLTYLRTITPSSGLLAIEINFALNKKDWQSAWDAPCGCGRMRRFKMSATEQLLRTPWCLRSQAARKSDLSSLFAVCHAALVELSVAGKCLRSGQVEEVYSHAAQSWELYHTPEAALAFLACLARNDFTASRVWHHRAVTPDPRAR
jgi:hypothetical protein